MKDLLKFVRLPLCNMKQLVTNIKFSGFFEDQVIFEALQFIKSICYIKLYKSPWYTRKNLFPKLKKKFFLEDNEVDTGVRAVAPYKSVNKERLRSSLYREEEPDYSQDYSLDYTQTDLQSGLGDPAQSGHLITVTHQVPTRTIFTVVERGQTKSLFAEVLETSLQVS